MTSTFTSIIFKELASEHLKLTLQCAEQLGQPIAAACDALMAAIGSGAKILVFGNGGSAADADHFAAELIMRFEQERDPVAAVSLCGPGAVSTAIANDSDSSQIFARQVQALGRAGDVAMAITTSGQSENVTRAVLAARDMGMLTIGLTGRDGGDLGPLLDYEVRIPSNSTARIQEMHILVIHTLCAAIDADLTND